MNYSDLIYKVIKKKAKRLIILKQEVHDIDNYNEKTAPVHRRGCWYLLRNPCHGNEFQVKVPDEGVDFRPVLRGYVLHNLLHYRVVGIEVRWGRLRCLWCDGALALENPADEDIGDVGTACKFLRRGVLLQDV